ncbi:MAG: ATP-binding cassette domain-containing protein [Pseudoflavonifractor sp.]|nr:ATP-binding cassette domain-containing protein [Pseudoflavonifractor sp.]
MISSITLRRVLPCAFAGMENDPAVAASQVWLSYLTLERGGRYLIEASSGAGKSSLCAFVYGERRDYMGEILFDGRDIRALSIDGWCRVRREEIALLPQEMRLFPELTAMENIAIKNRLTRFRDDAAIRRMLDRLGVGDKADAPAQLMSVGQQQRVALVRALCQPFSFLLLDEPVSHLDEANNAEVAALVADEVACQGAAVIATSVGNRLSISGLTTLRL